VNGHLVNGCTMETQVIQNRISKDLKGKSKSSFPRQGKGRGKARFGFRRRPIYRPEYGIEESMDAHGMMPNGIQHQLISCLVAQ
jgi:hypothetical protein